MARLATRDRTAKSGGFLVVEAIVACFLFVFAFAASAALFEASLRWVGQSSNYRQAGFLAERKMEEIRASVSQIPSGLSFSQHLDSILSGPHPPYDGFSEFEFEVELLDNEHKVVESSGFKPDDGVHSPCSAFYTRPDTPTSVSRTAAPYANDPEGDFQKNATYSTYPYSRSMPDSYRLVQVRVTFGESARQNVELISLIGDPISPPKLPANSSDDNLNVAVRVVRESGPADLTSSTASAVYHIEVTTQSGSKVDDVSAIWSIYPISSGSVDIFPLDAAGTRVRVSRNGFSSAGTSVRLFPQIRYESIEARALSEEIRL